jgi:hypothetical protein
MVSANGGRGRDRGSSGAGRGGGAGWERGNSRTVLPRATPPGFAETGGFWGTQGEAPTGSLTRPKPAFTVSENRAFWGGSPLACSGGSPACSARADGSRVGFALFHSGCRSRRSLSGDCG